MTEQNEKEISLDILKHVEDLSNKVNQMMEPHAKTVLRRYPITFGLLLFLAITALHEGFVEIMQRLGMLDGNPWYLIIIGLAILLITGTVYRKLEK